MATRERELPDGLKSLAELALDLRWTWNHQADHLWRRVDPDGWEATRNPWLLLQQATGDRLAQLARDPTFTDELNRLLRARRTSASPDPHREGGATTLDRPVAYFSMEYGLGDAIPLYAGGLGVLAGDHLEAASDLGIPMVAVGLLYQEGYFRQTVDEAGRQEELYPYNDPTILPIQPTPAPGGGWLKVAVELPGRTLWVRVWQAQVGRVTLYLLDTNDPTNEPIDRGITGKLYGDGPEMRLRQEIVLGIGGWRALEALDVHPGACHLNEGHAAFVILERARSAMRVHGLTFNEALAATRAGNVFTTHTPVAAGFDVFSPTLMRKYFPDDRGLLAELGIGFESLLALGRPPGSPDGEPFRPAHLAVRGSGCVNGVSALHGETSRHLFSSLFPRWPLAEVPISHVTNGVHVPSWDSSYTDELWTTACGPERWRRSGDDLASAICAVDDGKLWAVRGLARQQLVADLRKRLRRQLARRGGDDQSLAGAERILDADVLTIGMARRFAEYKRPNLLLHDQARLRRLLLDPHRPVQLLVAGKAHPDDADGKAMINDWVRFASDPEVRHRCVFIEDYDLTVAHELVQGVDVWLNTPRRPWEACGTSGMKVLVNGGLNLSALDGWWAEAYDPAVGWAIGHFDRAPDDADDARELLCLLETQVVPSFYDRDGEGLPRAWLGRIRASLSRLTPRYSASRMLLEYVSRCYRPAELAVAQRMAERARSGRSLDDWGQRLARHWPALRFGRCNFTDTGADKGFTCEAEVFFAELSPDDIAVQLYADQERPTTMEKVRALPGTANGYLFRAIISGDRPPTDYTPRLIPTSTLASVPLEMSLVTWHH